MRWKAQHKHFNSLLNKLEQSSRQNSHPTSPLKYTHTFLVDTFYPPDSSDGNKIRVTRDEKTGEVKACIKKIRLGNMDIFSPKRSVDWRLSVNLEVPGKLSCCYYNFIDTETLISTPSRWDGYHDTTKRSFELRA